MIFLDYYQQLTAQQKKGFADACGKKPGYMRHVAHGRRRAGPELAKLIDTNTQGVVTKEQLRPDIFGAATN